MIAKEAILASGEFGEAIHCFLNSTWAGLIESVGGFSSLEKHIRVLGCSADNRMIGRKSAGVIGSNPFFMDHRLHDIRVSVSILAISCEVLNPSNKKRMESVIREWRHRQLTRSLVLPELCSREHGKAGCSSGHHVAAQAFGRFTHGRCRSNRKQSDEFVQLVGNPCRSLIVVDRRKRFGVHGF